jgi:regulator of nucleoside diphosphate kinase
LGGADMPKEIYITKTDKEKLKKIIDDAMKSGNMLDKSMRKLEEEINNANVVDSREIPKNIITMNSRAVLHLNQEDIEVSLVYPDDADWSSNRLSVLSPIGTAILGYQEGDTIEWEVPSGVTKIQIRKVIYQPEASGDFHI